MSRMRTSLNRLFVLLIIFSVLQGSQSLCDDTPVLREIEDLAQIKDNSFNLAQAALLVSRDASRNLDRKEIDIGKYLLVIDKIAFRARSLLRKPSPSPEEIVAAINQVLYGEYGIRSQNNMLAKNIHDMKETHINYILDYRRGDCIGLSILYFIVAEKLGLDLEVCHLPTHILLRYKKNGKVFNIETTAGGVLFSEIDYAQFYRQRFPDQRFRIKTYDKKNILSTYLTNTAIIYFSMGFSEKAVTLLNLSIQLNSNYYEAYVSLGSIYVSQKRYLDAAKILEKAVTLNPGLAQYPEDNYDFLSGQMPSNKIFIYENIATCYFMSKKWKESIENLRKSLDYGKFSESIYLQMVVCHLMLNNPEQARLTAEEGLKTYPKSIQLKKILMETKDRRSAKGIDFELPSS